ncbi:MAG: hypothetical protein AB7T14_09155 [Candidatus Methylacidiphilaceae bacterium]
MIVLLAELFLDGRLSIRPEHVSSLIELLSRGRRAWGSEELWTPWSLSEVAGGLRVRKISRHQLARLLMPRLSGIYLLGDAAWNRIALQSGRVEEIWVRWRPEFGDGEAVPFVSEFHPTEGARLPLRLLQWRKRGDGGMTARYALLRNRA